MAQKDKKEIPDYLKFIFGGLSGMSATAIVQPLDLIKNRMQLSGMGGGHKEFKSTFHAFKHILSTEGIFAFYNGLSAGLLRQATYTTTRLGVYNVLFAKLSSPDGSPPSFMAKTMCGMIAGAIGAFVGTPAEVALVRMTSDGRLPKEQRRNYTSAVNAWIRIAREEGITTLWRGAIPTMCRAVVANAAQLATYSQANEMLLQSGYFKHGVPLHFCSSMISGLVTSSASLPVDILKTRMQNMKMIDGKPEFNGITDIFGKIIQKEGIWALWKGFTPYYARVGPHTVLTFLFLEQLNEAYRKLA